MAPTMAPTMLGSSQYWRVVNNGLTTWRPSVTDVSFYSNSDCTGKLIGQGASTGNPTYLCSGAHNNNGKACYNALDGSSRTSWRPHLGNCGAGQCWIGVKFASAVAVRCARTNGGLGKGCGGGHCWDGGMRLEYSGDGTSWTTWAASSKSGNTVIVGYPTVSHYRIYTTRMSNPSRWGFWCISEVRFMDAQGAEISRSGATATSSAEYHTSHEPQKALDGKCEPGTTHFCARKAPSIAVPEWWAIQFPSAKEVAAIKLQADPHAVDGVDPYDISVEWSNDDITWTTVTTVEEIKHGLCAETVISFDEPANPPPVMR